MAADVGTIDDYISTFPPEVQDVLSDIRSRLHATVPGMTEAMSYGIPTLKLDGRNLVHFAGWKRARQPLPGARGGRSARSRDGSVRRRQGDAEVSPRPADPRRPAGAHHLGVARDSVRLDRPSSRRWSFQTRYGPGRQTAHGRYPAAHGHVGVEEEDALADVAAAGQGARCGRAVQAAVDPGPAMTAERAGPVRGVRLSGPVDQGEGHRSRPATQAARSSSSRAAFTSSPPI